jgi:glycosyltransferase involved in cell wall biosynthesis
MRILVANDGFGDAGGVQQYLNACIGGLIARGHDVAMLHRDPIGAPARVSPVVASLSQFSVATHGLNEALASAREWQPDLCFSHNMDRLDVDRGLVAFAPLVKFMHGYLGTCISGLKRHAFPRACPCDRAFGPACAVLFLPRRCGHLSVSALVEQYGKASAQRDLCSRYTAIVVASGHMRDEYVRNGIDSRRLHVNPLFPTCEPSDDPAPAPAVDVTPTVAFLARMTPLKGGDLLIRAAADASRHLGRAIALTMIGDGPARADWEALARRLSVDATFTGWLDGDERFEYLRRADLVAVPSTWPEPFGLTGLEAAAYGVPAVAFDVGGVREWLQNGTNGLLVDANPPTASALAVVLADAFRDRARLAAMRPRALAIAREMSLTRHVDRLEVLFEQAAPRTRPTAVARSITPSVTRDAAAIGE